MPPKRKTAKTTNSVSKTSTRKPTAADKKKLLDIIECIHFLDEEGALHLLEKLATKETIKHSPSNKDDYENNKHLFLVNTLVSNPFIQNGSILSQACLYGMHNVVKKIIDMGGDVEHVAQDVVELASLSEDTYQSSANKIDLRGANMLHICSLKLMIVDTMIGILEDDAETRMYQNRIYKTSSIDYLECVNLITTRLMSLQESSSVYKITNGIWDNEDAKRTTLETVNFLTIKSTPSGYLNSTYGFRKTNPRIANPLDVMYYIEQLIAISINNFSAETNTTPLYTLLFSNPLFFSDIMASVVEDGTGLTELYEKKQELVMNIMSRLVQSQATIDGKDSGSNVETYQNIKAAINMIIGESDPLNLVEHSKGGPIIGAIGAQTRAIQNPDSSILRFYETLQRNIDTRTRVKPKKGALTHKGTSQYVPQRRSPSQDKSGAAVRSPRAAPFMTSRKTRRNKRVKGNLGQPSPGASSPRGRITRGKKPIGNKKRSKTPRTV